MQAAASAAVEIGGNLNEHGRSRTGGKIRSRHIFSAGRSQSQFDGSPGQTLAFSVEQTLRDERRLMAAAAHHAARIAGFPRFPAVRPCFRFCVNIINMFGHTNNMGP